MKHTSACAIWVAHDTFSFSADTFYSGFIVMRASLYPQFASDPDPFTASLSSEGLESKSALHASLVDTQPNGSKRARLDNSSVFPETKKTQLAALEPDLTDPLEALRGQI
jgi:hypothetical protein